MITQAKRFHSLSGQPIITLTLGIVKSYLPVTLLDEVLENEHKTQYTAQKASNHHANLPLEMYSFTL